MTTPSEHAEEIGRWLEEKLDNGIMRPKWVHDICSQVKGKVRVAIEEALENKGA